MPFLIFHISYVLQCAYESIHASPGNETYLSCRNLSFLYSLSVRAVKCQMIAAQPILPMNAQAQLTKIKQKLFGS